MRIVMDRSLKVLPQGSATEPLTPGEAALMLAALGNPIRMRAFRHLVEADGPGLKVGTLQNYLKLPASTLNHHLTALSRCGLIRQRRIGREVQNEPSLENLQRLERFLEEMGTLSFLPGDFRA